MLDAETENAEIPDPDQEQKAEAAGEGENRKVDCRNFDHKLGWREALGFEHPIKGW